MTAATLLAACTRADAPTGPARSGDGIVVVPQPALIPSAADASAAPVHRIRLLVSSTADSVVLATETRDVSPSAAQWTLSLAVRLPSGEVDAAVLASLLHVDGDGAESVQFSGRSAPLTLRRGEEASPELMIVRGPPANLSATSVTITSAPAALEVAEIAALGATVTASGSAIPTVFWTSLDPAVATLAGSTVTAVAHGTARIVASAGAFADTVRVTVGPPDTTPPEVVATLPAGGATGVSVGALVTLTFDGPLDPTSVTGSSFALQTAAGLPVAGSVSYGNSAIVFDPSAPLDTLTAYVATLLPGIRDVAGNTRTASFQWGFTTSAQRLGVSTSFDPGLGVLVAIGLDRRTGNLFLYDDFATAIFEYTPAGVQVAPTIPNPGIASNDHDFDFLPEAANIGGTVVSADALIVMNGEDGPPRRVYAVDKDTGTVLASVTIPMSDPVGLSYHATRNTFFGMDWTRDVVEEIDPATGALLASFPVAPVGGPVWSTYYGDIEVDQSSGNLMLVSSDQPVVRIMSPTGTLLADVPVGHLDVSGMSGIAWDDATGTAWISTISGTVLQLVGISP